MSLGGQASTKPRITAARFAPSICSVLGNVALIFSMRFSCEKRASRWSNAGSMPSRGSAATPSSPKMAAPLVRYASNLACRSSNRFAMTLSQLSRRNARADTRQIVENLVDRVEPVVAFENDDRRPVPPERIGEQVERRVGHRMGMRVGEERPPRRFLAHRHAARHVHFPHQPGRQVVEERVRVEPVIGRIEENVLNVEQKPGTALPAEDRKSVV